jgi:gluconate 2-dehydrogenase gamma chain
MLDRRSFLCLVAALASQLPAAARVRSEPEATGAAGHDASAKALQDPWLTLAAVQAHLLPGGDAGPGSKAPSAAEIGALSYLRNALAAPDMDPQDGQFIRDGVGWLNEVAQEAHGRPYSQLGAEPAEQVMRRIERSAAGERWLFLLLGYLLEALLADPVYGGNRDGRGWAWLEHRPGYPRPPADKLYYKLGKPVYKRTKA